MDVLEAIRGRKSVRGFKPDPVPVEVLTELLTIAQRAPSGTNTQPWHVYVCAGDVKQALTDETLEMFRAGAGRGYEEFDYYPATWKDVHNNRRREVGWALYNLVGVEKGDREGSAKQAMRNYLFFDAPVGIFVTVDSYLKYGNWMAAGIYIQTLMLAAEGLGLATCAQGSWIPYQEAVRKNLGIPDDESVVVGMSLGYADPDRIENSLITVREPLENVVHWRGFD